MCCWTHSKGSFTGISCGNCYSVTKALRSCQYKVPRTFVCAQVCVSGWVGWEDIPHWLTLRSHKASTAYHMQHSPCSLHRKTDFTATSHQTWWCVACGEKWLCSLSSDFFFSSQSEPAVTSQGKDKAVQQKSGRKEWRERVEGFFIIFFQTKKGFLRFEVRFTAACAHVMSELKTPCFSGRLILNALWESGE